MKGWQDTVKNEFTPAREQAKATWDIAYQQGLDDCALTHFKPDWKIKAKDIADASKEGREAGIKEVVNQLAHSKVFFPGTEETKKVWWLVDETKLKEWGITK